MLHTGNWSTGEKKRKKGPKKKKILETIKGKFPKLTRFQPKYLRSSLSKCPAGHKENHTPSSNKKYKEQILKCSQTKRYLILKQTMRTTQVSPGKSLKSSHRASCVHFEKSDGKFSCHVNCSVSSSAGPRPTLETIV